MYLCTLYMWRRKSSPMGNRPLEENRIKMQKSIGKKKQWGWGCSMDFGGRKERRLHPWAFLSCLPLFLKYHPEAAETTCCDIYTPWQTHSRPAAERVLSQVLGFSVVSGYFTCLSNSFYIYLKKKILKHSNITVAQVYEIKKQIVCVSVQLVHGLIYGRDSLVENVPWTCLTSFCHLDVCSSGTLLM